MHQFPIENKSATPQRVHGAPRLFDNDHSSPRDEPRQNGVTSENFIQVQYMSHHNNLGLVRSTFPFIAEESNAISEFRSHGGSYLPAARIEWRDNRCARALEHSKPRQKVGGRWGNPTESPRHSMEIRISRVVGETKEAVGLEEAVPVRMRLHMSKLGRQRDSATLVRSYK
jgi:hypothetical protein